MSESKFETVSALMDNDQQNIEELDRVSEDEQLAQRWENYHLIGDILRDDVPDTIVPDLSAQIAQAIAEEPTVLAPKKSKSRELFTAAKAKVVQLGKPFGQVAIAASAAGLMIFGVQQTNVAENDTVAPIPQVIKTMPFGGVADPVSLNYQTPDREAQKQAYIQQQRRFQALLADHNQQIKLSAVNKDDAKEEQKVEETAK